MDMQVSEIGSKITCVRLTGRLDALGAGRIDKPFTAAVVAQARDTVVDLSGVSFVASMGIRLLIASARGLSVKGANMVLFGAQDLVYTALDQAALDQIIPIAATEGEAIARLAG